MVWARFEDRFPWHRKVRRLHDSAFRLHVSAVCWCSEHLTDGDIHADELEMVSDTRNPSRHAAQLVAVGLWDQTEWGWRIHDFLTYNPSREKVLADRDAAKERQRKARELSQSRRDIGRTNAGSHNVTSATPTRPDPPPFQGGEGRGRLKAVPPTPTANQSRCPVHPHELAHNCRSCAADMKAGGL